MDRNQALWAALKLRGELAHLATLPAEQVRSTGVLLGFGDEELVTAIIRLSEQNLVQLPGNGSIQVLQPVPSLASAPASGLVINTVHGNVIQSTGPNATFDLRTYSEAPPVKLEEIIAGLAAAAAELRAAAVGLPAEEAAQIEAVADTAGEVAREAQADAPDKPALLDRLKQLTAGAEEVSKFHIAVTKLGPAWATLATGLTALRTYFGG